MATNTRSHSRKLHLFLLLPLLSSIWHFRPGSSQSAARGQLGSLRVRNGSQSSLQELLVRASGGSQQLTGEPASNQSYKCAKYCTCSIVQVIERNSNMEGSHRPTNYTQAKCESNLFSDILTIDRRTHIIQISLSKLLAGEEDELYSESSLPNDQRKSGSEKESKRKSQFRMPRLVQFNNLREILVINLKFQVCDTEVFKRGQKLRRLHLNHNRLVRVSKACFRYLDKLLELNLDHNELDELESALFNSLHSLRRLSIANNKLSELAAHQFANLTKLEFLNLMGNSFKSINLHLFEPMQNSLRLLLLAKNQIKSFTYAPLLPTNQTSNSSLSPGSNSPNQSKPALAGIVFRNLVKLNVDENKIERIKLIQLHRFFNVKFLSIRQNQIASIRDKAFNGLRLYELNLAHNQLQSISKCAFCNATIKRLVLANNNISVALPSVLLVNGPAGSGAASGSTSQMAAAAALVASAEPEGEQLPAAVQSLAAEQAASSSPNTLILSQSIFGPLFGRLEYLDLSRNELLAEALELLLEPLLQLEYLNLASVGIERSLPTPNLFKNNRKLRYLNLSHNQLDLVVSQTIEPLGSLEVLDLSHNKLSEMDESFLYTLDEFNTNLKLVNLASNPWFCSQCKVTALHDWILRSAIYNSTCIAGSREESPASLPAEPAARDEAGFEGPLESRGGFGYKLNVNMRDYSVLTDAPETLNFETVHHSPDLKGEPEESAPGSPLDSLLPAAGEASAETAHLKELLRELATVIDDGSIAHTLAAASTSSFRAVDFCMRCEFPGELRDYELHELSPSDFKFCAGSAPRLGASEPKIGLTLALVIICALIFVIIVIVILYRKKHNTYYPNESTDRLDEAGAGKKAARSVSSERENGYNGDATDYSSPPMSQSMESYSQYDEEDEDEEGLEFEYEEEEDEEELGEEEEEELEEEEIGDIDESASETTTGGSQQSLRSNAKRMAEAEMGRHRQLAEYNLRNGDDKTLHSGPSSLSLQLPAGSGGKARQSSSTGQAPTVSQIQVELPPPPEPPSQTGPANVHEPEVKVVSSQTSQEDNSVQMSGDKRRADSESLASYQNDIRPEPAEVAPVPKPRAVQPQSQLRQQSSLQSSQASSSHNQRRSAVKSAQTMDSSIRQPASSAAPGAKALAAALDLGEGSSSARKAAAQLGRQRQFASSSKEPNWQAALKMPQKQQQQTQLVREAPQPAALADVDFLLAAAELEAARAEVALETPRLASRPLSNSDELTAADSVPLELGSEPEESFEPGGALEAPSPEPAEVRRLGQQAAPEPKSSLAGSHSNRSSHSALTQTSTLSRDD